MITTFLLGLSGSLGHCVGMCGGVTLLLQQAGMRGRGGIVLAHLGRLTTYSLLGLLAGLAGQTLAVAGGHAHHAAGASYSLSSTLRLIQTVLTLLAAAFAVHMALSLLGLAPAPERRLHFLSRRWGQLLQRARQAGSVSPFLLGLLWGLLPCGLVLTALLAAAASSSPLTGALTMLVFGAGTAPALLGMALLGGLFKGQKPPTPVVHRWGRGLAALIVLFFGVQLALRGLASWDLVPHLHVAGVMLW